MSYYKDVIILIKLGIVLCASVIMILTITNVFATPVQDQFKSALKIGDKKVLVVLISCFYFLSAMLILLTWLHDTEELDKDNVNYINLYSNLSCTTALSFLFFIFTIFYSPDLEGMFIFSYILSTILLCSSFVYLHWLLYL